MKSKPDINKERYVSISLKKELISSNKTSKKHQWPWNYKNDFPHFQSPVDINFTKLQKGNFPPLLISIPNDVKETCIINTGQGVKVTEAVASEKLTLSGSFLSDTYVFDEIRYHWGEFDNFGSEHFIDGEAYSGEVHIITHRKEYKNLNRAIEHNDGVIILAFFFQVGSLNPRLETLLRYLPGVKYEGSFIKVLEPDPLLWFMPDLMMRNQSHYYICPGSLTTSPYKQCVTYLLLPTPLCISPSQLNKFRNLKNRKGKNLLSNRREIQPMLARQIFVCQEITWNSLIVSRSYTTRRLTDFS